MPIEVPSTNDLATVDDLTAFRRGDPLTLVAQANALVREYCNWHITPSRIEDLTVKIPSRSPDDLPAVAPYRRTVFLPSMHLTAVSAVTLDGQALTEGVDYEWHEGGYLVRLGLPWIDVLDWTGKSRTVVASVTHGYPIPPADVQSVALDVANRAITAVKAGGVIRLRVGGVDRQFGKSSSGAPAAAIGLTDDNKSTLAPYRVPVA